MASTQHSRAFLVSKNLRPKCSSHKKHEEVLLPITVGTYVVMKFQQSLLLFLLVLRNAQANNVRRNLRRNFSLQTRLALDQAVQSAIESPSGQIDEQAMDYAISLGLTRNAVIKSVAYELRKNGNQNSFENDIKEGIPNPPAPLKSRESAVDKSTLADPRSTSYKEDNDPMSYWGTGTEEFKDPQSIFYDRRRTP